MNAAPDINAILVLLVGVTTAAAMLLRTGCIRLGVPPLVGFLLLGVALSTLDNVVTFLSPTVREGLGLLASLGLVALLFRIGLGLSPKKLIAKVPKASLIWLGNVAVSGLLGYFVAAWVLDLDMIPSLVTAVALTATSIGVVMPIWEESGAIGSDAGNLTVDIAELDDLSGVVLMALLFATLPVLQSGEGSLWSSMLGSATNLALRFAGFTALCWLFAHYAEPALYRLLHRWQHRPERLLTIVGLGAAIAAIAGMLGFSLAIGALFAGLVFSAYPERVQSERSYQALYTFLTPYFFIGIGLQLAPELLLMAVGIGLVLAIAAVAGKLVGTYIPARLTTDRASARLIALSMVPRAEIAMVIVHQAHQLGPWAMTDELYAAMAVVSLLTCTFIPPVLGRMLAKYHDCSYSATSGRIS